jgi:transcriptional regulator with XRE-family HTH domain
MLGVVRNQASARHLEKADLPDPQARSKLDRQPTSIAKLKREDARESWIHRSMLFRYLRGQSIPSSRVLQLACQKLGVTVDYRGVRVDADFFNEDAGVEKVQPVFGQEQFAFMRDLLTSDFTRVDIRKKKHPGSETLELRMTIRLRKQG